MKPLKTFGLPVMTKVLISPLFALACLVGVPAAAQVNYAITNGTAYVAASPNASGDIVIASTFNGYPVTAIADFAFSSFNVTSVTIPSSVTIIGNYAFYWCISLTNVTIPNSVTTIGDWAFSVCPGLANVTIPDSVTSIGARAFFSCDSLTNVVIPNSLTTIGEGAFSDCDNLTNVAISDKVTTIGNLMFAYCPRLAGVTIPNSVNTIGGGAFRDCISLASVTIPDSVINLRGAVFLNCTSLTNVTLGSGLTSIEDNNFRSTSLTSVTIPNNVTHIGSYAFSFCPRLRSVTIGNGVNSIGFESFYNCTNLTSITFLGNAPLLFSSIEFYAAGPNATVYYYYGTTGWGPWYAGLPTVMLGIPAMRFDAETVGVKPGGFGFTVTGIVNQIIRVEASTNLVTWQPVWTNTLSAGSAFVDPQWLNHPRRFYRMRSN